MVKVVDEVTDFDKLHNHVLSLEQSLDKMLKYQLILTDQIEKLTNYNVNAIVKEVLQEIFNPTIQTQKLSKNEKMRLDATNLSNQRKLDLIKKFSGK